MSKKIREPTSDVEPAAASVSPRRILVVDDEPEILEIVSSALAQRGFSVSVANDGSEAQSRLETEHFDFIISDVVMPKVNGLELLRYVRALKHVVVTPPVILISGNSSVSLHEFIECGAEAVFPKPIDFERLFATIGNAVVPFGPEQVAERQALLRRSPSRVNLNQRLRFLREGGDREGNAALENLGRHGMRISLFRDRLRIGERIRFHLAISGTVEENRARAFELSGVAQTKWESVHGVEHDIFSYGLEFEPPSQELTGAIITLLNGVKTGEFRPIDDEPVIFY